MARIVAFIPDLLFGSNVAGALQAAGHEPVLVSNETALRSELAGADALILDLTADPSERLAQAADPGVPTLAFYSHVEADVRAEAERAGIDVVVPRSRMAREGAALIARLVGPDQS